MNREPVELHRRNVSAKRRQKIIDAAAGICVRSWCSAPAVAVDHITPLWQGGTNDDPNLEALCVDCHGMKTRAEASLRAKVGRIEKAAAKAREKALQRKVAPDAPQAGKLSGRGWAAGKSGKAPIQSRGFSKDVSRRMDGTVGPRKPKRKK